MKNDIFLSLKNMYKTYPNGVQAVHDFNLDVKPKEFIVFVGPSGCGKSTTLRMIAGLEEITHGDLYIDQRLANNLSPKDRDIAMVFQSYALYPHMNVYNNLAFGLRMRKIRENVLDQNGKIVTGFDHKQVRHIEKDLHHIAQDL
ncbi:MAG TPA: ATP-binding cassette domain-containing protein, partial [Bacilli bacterium]|nr:ATP-binding cassette domain-containing protein [Bacilli bacterium]